MAETLPPERSPKPISAADRAVEEMKNKQKELGPLQIPTDEELARKERESAELVVKHFTELGMPGSVNVQGEAVFDTTPVPKPVPVEKPEIKQENPKPKTPRSKRNKPRQLSFGMFDATEPPALPPSIDYLEKDPEQGINDMHRVNTSRHAGSHSELYNVPLMRDVKAEMRRKRKRPKKQGKKGTPPLSKP